MKLNRRQVITGATASALSPWLSACGSESGLLKVASLKSGSVSWLLKTIAAEGLDKKNGLQMEIVDMATNSAGPIALMSGGVDVIVSDWPWALRQRSQGASLQFSPYSSALGALTVGPDSGIATLADLKGKRLAVAGSAVDKSWLLLRAYSRKTLGEDIADSADLQYGAPPLMAEQLRLGRADAVLNFWTFSARLVGQGYKKILTIDDVMRQLEIEPSPPLVGFVWNDQLATTKGDSLKALFASIKAGNDVLAKSDEAWERLKPKMKVKSDEEFRALIEGYRAGIPNAWGEEHTKSAEKLFGLLAELGGDDLVGANTKFDPKLFASAA